MAIHFSEGTTVNNSQIIDKVEGDAILNANASTKDLSELIVLVKRLANEADFSDSELSEICEHFAEKSEEARPGFIARLTSYASSLNTLAETGELVGKYGPAAVTFLATLRSVIGV